MKFNDLPAPYTETKIGTNLKERKVFCPHCKYELVTDLPGPICGKCHSNLITILRRNNDIFMAE